MPHFLLIDGTNLYLSARERDEEVDCQQPDPCLDAVESLIANCLANDIPFKCYFDSSANHHFRWWAANGGAAGKDAQRRFEALRALGEARVKVADVGEADMFILLDARTLLPQHDVYIVTRDRFRDRKARYPELGPVDHRGRPQRCLPFATSKVEGARSLVFPWLPQFGGEMSPDVQIPIKAHADIADRVRASAGEPKQKDKEKEQAAGRAETKILEEAASLSIGGFRIHGNRDVYAMGLRRLGLRAAGLDSWPVSVGRSDDQDFVVSESFDAVSRRQLEFHRDEPTGRITVIDKGSANGTWMNGRKLEPGVATPLLSAEGLITMVGSSAPGSHAVHLYFENLPDAQEETGEQMQQEGSSPVLHVRLASGRQLRYPIATLPFRVGTAVSGNGASLGFPEVISVSREHLEITEATGGEGFLVRPIGRNGTSFNGALQESPFVLPFAKEVVLSPRDAQTGNVAVWITRQ